MEKGKKIFLGPQKDVAGNRKNESVVTQPPGVRSTKVEPFERLENAQALQTWWRVTNLKRSKSQERLQKVHKVVFALSMFVRSIVVSYLVFIAYTVLHAISYKDAELLNAANADDLERGVLHNLMKDNSAGDAIVVACSVLIFAYIAAQAYSIYSLIPRKTGHESKANNKGGILNKLLKVLAALQRSKIYKFYESHRYPTIPIGVQIFEIIVQIGAFDDYARSVPTRLPLLVWATLISLDNIITPWLIFQDDDCIGGKRTKWDRVLPGVSLVFSLSYAFVIPLLMYLTWQSILGNVRFKDLTPRMWYSELFNSTYARNYLIGAGDSGISFGFEATEGLYRAIGKEVFMTSPIRLLAAYFPLVNVLVTLRNMETRYDTSRAKSVIRANLGSFSRLRSVHPQASVKAMKIFRHLQPVTKSVTDADKQPQNGQKEEEEEKKSCCTKKCYARAKACCEPTMKVSKFVVPCIMTSLSLVFITVVYYGAFREVCQGQMWDACYSRTFHVFDFTTECPCVVYIATSPNEKPWICNSDRDCAEYEWCASSFNDDVRQLECIPSVCPRNTLMSCRDEEHISGDCRLRRKQVQRYDMIRG